MHFRLFSGAVLPPEPHLHHRSQHVKKRNGIRASALHAERGPLPREREVMRLEQLEVCAYKRVLLRLNGAITALADVREK
jgi:hypothetical protein